MTTRQLAHLVAADHPVELELDVSRILDDSPGAADRHVEEVAARAVDALASGNVVVRTTRTLVRTDDPAESLAIARSVSTALVTVVARTLAARPPRFVVAKGGITSSDVAARGLSIKRAMVRGSLLPGIVSLWEPVDGPARGIPYVVFAGQRRRPGVARRRRPHPVVLSGASAARSPHHSFRRDHSMTITVAVLGLGAMGLPMARHLASTFTVRAYDIDPARGAAAGGFAQVCSTARDAAAGSDAVLVAVRNHEQLLALLWGDDGIVPALAEGAVVILTSTVGIEAVRDVAERLAGDKVHLVDAPVSGGPGRAGTGDLLVVVGADDDAWEAGRPSFGRWPPPWCAWGSVPATASR